MILKKIIKGSILRKNFTLDSFFKKFKYQRMISNQYTLKYNFCTKSQTELQPQPKNQQKYSKPINPYTYIPLPQKKYISNKQQLYGKIAACTKAHLQWKSQYSIKQRIEKVRQLIDSILKDQSQRKYLKERISQEIGKSYKDIQRQFEILEKFAYDLIDSGQRALQLDIQNLQKQYKEKSSQNVIHKIEFESVGLSLIFPYYSQPILDSFIHLIPCLISGGGALIKHSDFNSFLGQYLQQKVSKVLKIKSLVKDIFIHPQQLQDLAQFRSIKKVIYSGSHSSAKHIFETLVKKQRFIDCNLFFGGQDAAYVDSSSFLNNKEQIQDDKIKKIVKEIIKSAFYNNGQSFDCIKRLYLNFKKDEQDQLKQKFINFLIQETQSLQIGNPQNQTIDIGPLGIQQQALKIQSLLTDSINDDAIILTGGILTNDLYDQNNYPGRFLQPTILLNCTSDLPIVQTQTQAPILCVFQVQSQENFVLMVNQNQYGTGIRMFTKNPYEQQYHTKNNRITKQMIDNLQVGRIVFNQASMLSRNLPIQGWKKSGKGKILSKFSYQEYTIPKVFNIHLL